jgi:hypothetical protein
MKLSESELKFGVSKICSIIFLSKGLFLKPHNGQNWAYDWCTTVESVFSISVFTGKFLRETHIFWDGF